MELVTFDQLDGEENVLEYNLNNEVKVHYLTNVAKHISPIYKFKNSKNGNVKDKYIIKFSGNKKSLNDSQDVAYCVLIKEKEASRYLISVDEFNLNFTEII